ncbi:MAG TPA: MopE-related protein [Myxococcota bacterium]|nr:MopE-related protein [Myxococcota bacterium]
MACRDGPDTAPVDTDSPDSVVVDSPVDSEVEDCPTWFPDMDRDGYGVAEGAFEACVQPVASAAIDGDCDDDDSAVHPGAAEHCDGRDEDCDGIVDEDPVDPPTWYLDDDQDLWGLDETVVQACEAPEGYVDRGGDCDDADASSYPGAEEICGDRADNDCAGDGDPACRLVGEVDLADASAKLLGDRAGEIAGTITWLGGDSNADGTTDLAVLATGQFSTGKDLAGRLYLLTQGPYSDADLADADAVLTDEDRTLTFGSALGVVPDLNGDGYDDLVAGASSYNTVYVHLGPVSGPRDLDDSDLDFTGSTGGHLAMGMAAPGDMDGDAWNDLLLGGPGHLFDGGTYPYTGQAYLFLGPITSSRTPNDASAELYLGPGHDYSFLGRSACAGDLDGDGLLDVALGAPGAGRKHGTVLNDSGAVYVVHGPLSGALPLVDGDGQLDAATVRFEGEQSQDFAGTSLDCSGDVNADGHADILVGAPHNNSSDEDSQGTAYLITNPATGKVSLAQADWVLSGDSAGDFVGITLTSGSDLDADGLADIAVGSYADDLGEVYVFYGSVTGTAEPADADATLVGESAEDYASHVAGGADADADGFDDLLIGAPGESTSGTWAGAAYLVRGGDE